MKLKKVQKAFREGGFLKIIERVIRFYYRKLKFLLPQRYGIYNGVEVPSHKLFETVIDSTQKFRPEYESGLVSSLRENISEGDKVIILGGGIGVTAVKAESETTEDGKVIVYEASKSQIEKITETIEINQASNIEVKQAIVGEEIDTWGSTEGAKKLKPDEIPNCDVLEMDIEGSEVSVLKEMKIEPRKIIVETHGNKGASTRKVKSILEDKGFIVEEEKLAEQRDSFEEKDIRVLVAKKS